MADSGDIDIPKEAKWNANQEQLKMVMFLKSEFKAKMRIAREDPTVENIHSAALTLNDFYDEVEPILPPEVDRDISVAFIEFGEWYSKRCTPPERRKVKISSDTLSIECINRLREIYRKLNVTMQKFHIFYDFKESRQNIDEKLEIIEEAIHGSETRKKRAQRLREMDGKESKAEPEKEHD